MLWYLDVNKHVTLVTADLLFVMDLWLSNYLEVKFMCLSAFTISYFNL